jgi:hypothetical protein
VSLYPYRLCGSVSLLTTYCRLFRKSVVHYLHSLILRFTNLCFMPVKYKYIIYHWAPKCFLRIFGGAGINSYAPRRQFSIHSLPRRCWRYLPSHVICTWSNGDEVAATGWPSGLHACARALPVTCLCTARSSLSVCCKLRPMANECFQLPLLIFGVPRDSVVWGLLPALEGPLLLYFHGSAKFFQKSAEQRLK